MQLMKIIGFVALVITLFAALFQFGGADLNNNVTAVAVMVLLLSIFSDLKEFNFWGLRGKKQEIEKKLDELEGKDVLVAEKLPKTTRTKIEKARQNTHVIQDPHSTFLQLAYEIRKQMLIMLAVVTGEKISPETHLKDANQILYKRGSLSFDGFNQIEQVRVIRNELLYGNPTNITEQTLRKAIEVAENVYKDLKDWMDKPRTK